MHIQRLQNGGMNLCNVDQTTIFKTVLLCNAKKFILVHNHPSESAVASRYDIKVTDTIMKNAKLLNVIFLDHIIIAGNNYVSCMEEIALH